MIYTVKLVRTFEQEIDIYAKNSDEALDVVDTILNRTNLLDVKPAEETESHFTTAIKSVSEDDTGSLYRLENDDEEDDDEDFDNDDDAFDANDEDDDFENPYRRNTNKLFGELYDVLYGLLYDELFDELYETLYDELHNDILGVILSVPSQTIKSLKEHAVPHPLEGE